MYVPTSSSMVWRTGTLMSLLGTLPAVCGGVQESSLMPLLPIVSSLVPNMTIPLYYRSIRTSSAKQKDSRKEKVSNVERCCT